MKLKRIFALLIAAVMIISLAAVNVSAAKTTKGVALNKTSASVTAGKYITLKPTVTGYKKYTLVWSTSNKDVAAVTAGGKVTVKKAAAKTSNTNKTTVSSGNAMEFVKKYKDRLESGQYSRLHRHMDLGRS